MTAAKAITAAAAVLLFVAVLNLSGFCFRKFSFLSEADLIERAIASRANEISDFADANVAVTSESVRAYVTRHPNCCAVTDRSWLPGNLLNDLTGFKSTLVRVDYALSKARVEGSPGEGSFFEALVQLSSCGEVVGSFGQRLKAAPNAM